MSRIIHTKSNGTIRKKHLEGIAAALRYASTSEMDESEKKDILAYFALSLSSIHDLNEKTISAWEKRGYWVKADRFRMQWRWVDSGLQEIEKNLKANDIDASIMAAIMLAQHLSEVRLSARMRSMKPWIHAWKLWNETQT